MTDIVYDTKVWKIVYEDGGPKVRVTFNVEPMTVTVGGGGGATLSNNTPHALGVAAHGSGTQASRDDHVHAMPSASDVGALTQAAADSLYDADGAASSAQTAAESFATAADTTALSAAEAFATTAAGTAQSNAEGFATSADATVASNAQAALDAAMGNLGTAALHDAGIATSNDLPTYLDVQTIITNLINSAPSNLDTLGEIATQLASDESAVSALITTVSGKLAKASNLSDLNSASTARTNLGLGSLATKSAIASADITDGTIVDADISVSAAIAVAKIAGLGSLATKSAIASADITDGTIVSGDINASAGITLTQLASIADQTILGNNAGSSGPPLGLTATQVKTILALSNVTNDAQVKISSFTAKGVMLLGSGTGTLGQLGVGSNNQALLADSTSTVGMAWHTLVASNVSDFDTQVRTSRLDQMAAPTNDVSFNSHKGTNVATPTATTDVVNKAYADALTGEVGPVLPITTTTIGFAATCDPFQIATTVTPSGGRALLTPIRLIAGQVISNISVDVSTAAAGSTHWWYAITDGSANHLVVAKTADQLTATMAGAAMNTLALTAPYTVPTTGLYFIATLSLASVTNVAYRCVNMPTSAPSLAFQGITGLTGAPNVGDNLTGTPAGTVGHMYAVLS